LIVACLGLQFNMIKEISDTIKYFIHKDIF